MHRTAVSDAAAVKVSLVVIDAVVCDCSMHSCALRGPPLVMHAARPRAKRLSGKIEDRSERPVATRRMSGDNGSGLRERGLSEPESRGSLSISAACSTSFPPVSSPHIAVSARKSSSGSPRYPSNPRAATAAQFSNPPAPKHKHHGWRSKHAGGAGLRLDGGRPQEVV